MRTYRQATLTGTAGLELIEEAIPQPGVGEVLVRVRATSLNFRDTLIATGRLPFPVPAGHVPLRAIGVGSRADLEDTIRSLAVHETRPVIARTYEFDDAPAAFDDLAGGGHFGKLVIRH
jgi:NADPH:quinone reductase-like Zn-dependent oxidoreductase